jgi:hypothetical protein
MVLLKRNRNQGQGCKLKCPRQQGHRVKREGLGNGVKLVNWGEWKIAVGLLSRSGVGVPHFFFFRLGGSGRVFLRFRGAARRNQK